MLSTSAPAVPLPDVEAAIADSNGIADAIRGELPPLGVAVCAATAQFACGWWEQEARRVIQQNPERAMASADKFPQLKSEVRELQRAGDEIAARHYEATFSDETVTSRVRAILDGPQRDADGLLVPDGWSRVWEEPLRHVLGEIGPALAHAGLTSANAMSLDPTSAIDPNGRYRYALEIPAELTEAAELYDAKLRELALALTDVAKFEQEKLRQRAIALWDAA